MPGKSSHVTIDHEEIRRWAEERGGRPAMVKGTGGGDQTGIIRLDFPGYSGEGKLEEISWDDFFDKFEESNLALVYSETTRGQKSNFNKLISRESVDVETGEVVAPPRRRRKQAAGAEKAAPRRASRSTPAAAKGERRTPRSEAARKSKTAGPGSRTKGRSSQRGGARADPTKRGPSRGR